MLINSVLIELKHDININFSLEAYTALYLRVCFLLHISLECVERYFINSRRCNCKDDYAIQ